MEPIVTDADDLATLAIGHLVDDLDETVCNTLEFVVGRIVRLVRVTIAQGIGRDDAISQLGEVLNLMTPIVGR